MIGKTGTISFLCIALVVMTAGVVGTRPATEHRKAGRSTVHAEPIRLEGGWGYEIEVNEKPYIYQDQIPCISGRHLFPSRREAMAVARMVAGKIKKGQSPAISRKELEKLLPQGSY